MSRILRFLGLTDAPDDPAGNPALDALEARLADLPPDRASFFAAFTYVLARVAGADLDVDARERDAMARVLSEQAGLPESEAQLVADIAASLQREIGASANYIVTRQFRRMADEAERLRLIECLFAVAAADEHVSLEESNEILTIAEELALDRPQVLAIRARYRAYLAEFKKLASER